MTTCLHRLLMHLALALCALVAACGGGGGNEGHGAAEPSPTQSAGQWARANGHRTLMAAADKAGLAAQLDNPAAMLTLLAPTDAAFNALAQRLGLGDGDALVASMSPEVLAGLLRFHLMPSRMPAATLSAGGVQQDTTYTLDGQAAAVGVTTVGGLQVTDAMNAPSRVVTSDVAVTNGMVHVIDKVMVPPGLLGITQMVQSDPSLASFAQAMATAGMLALLDSDGSPFTVLAPTADVAAAVRAAATSGSADVTVQVVAHHVLWAPMKVAEMVEAGTVATAAQQTLTVEGGAPSTLTDATGLRARLTVTDIRARNGVIHVVDKVLLPAF